MTDSMASLWVGIGISRSTFLPLAITLWVRRPSMPMRSQRPLAVTTPVSGSMSWYLRLELPALMTSTFILTFTPVFLFSKIHGRINTLNGIIQ